MTNEVHSSTTDLESLLSNSGLNFGLLAPTTTVALRVLEDPEKLTFNLRFPDVYFDGESMLAVLSSLSPAARPQPINDIVADWGIVDRSGAYQRLINLHRALEPHWSDFNQHRRDLMQALDYRKPDTDRIVAYIRSIPVKKAEEIKQDALKSASRRPALLKRFYQAVHGKQLSKDALRKMTDDERNSLAAEALDYEDGVRKLCELEAYRDYIVIDGKRIVYAPSITMPYGFEGFVREGLIESNRQGYKVRIAFFAGSTACPLYGINVEEDLGGVLKLCLEWDTQKTDRARTFNFSAQPPVDGEVGKYNPLLGFVYAASFLPEVKSLFPEKMGLPGGNYQQLMREAQVPLLALMYRKRLIHSPFFEAVERSVLQ